MTSPPRSIAAFFPEGSISQWIRLLSNVRLVRNGEFTLRPASNILALDQIVPTVIVAHESSELSAYLRGNPTHLRWVHFMSAGLDRTLKELGTGRRPFHITNVRGIHGAAMREYVWATILYFKKQIPQLVASQRNREWNRLPLGLLMGGRLVVVGCGAIGRAIAASAATFGVEAIGVTKNPRPLSEFARVTGPDQLLCELPQADYVVLALPLTKETHGMLGPREFEAMKAGSILVNIARGKLVDSDALIGALKRNQLAGAALDAFEEEPVPLRSPLWDIPNLLLTPHISGKFEGGREAGVEVFSQQLEKFSIGEPLETEVWPERGY